MAQWVWALLSLRASHRTPWPPSAPAGGRPTRSVGGSTRWRLRGDSWRSGSSSLPYVPSGEVRHLPRNSRLLDYQHAQYGAGPGPARGRLLDRCHGVSGHPTVCVFSSVPGPLSVSGRLLFDLPVYTGLGLHYPQSRKPAFLPIVMSLNVCAFVASSEAPAGRAGPVPRTAPSSYGSSKMCNVTYQASPLNVRTTFTPGLHCGLGQIQGFVSLSLESQIFAICCSGSVKFWLLWNLKTVT